MQTTNGAFLKRRDQILIVDDDRNALETLGEALRQAGYSVNLAMDGYAALDAASRRRPDVVLSDLQMPGLNGLELVRLMHDVDPSLPVIFATGAEDTQDVITAAEGYGAFACLRKPMNLDDLLWTLDEALAMARQSGRGAELS